MGLGGTPKGERDRDKGDPDRNGCLYTIPEGRAGMRHSPQIMERPKNINEADTISHQASEKIIDEIDPALVES